MEECWCALKPLRDAVNSLEDLGHSLKDLILKLPGSFKKRFGVRVD